MKQLLYSLIIALFFLFAASISVSAQFEGEIQFQIEDFTTQQPEQSGFVFTAVNNRLFISSEQDVSVITGLKANGLLVRNDHQDFIFNTDTDQSLKVSKDDLDSLMDMIERFGGTDNKDEMERFDWENSVEETGSTRTHLGYELHEFRLKGEHDDQFLSFWLTSDIKVRWGLMVDIWNRAGNKFSDSELPIELIMNSTSFPLMLEVIDRGRLIYKVESVNVNTGNFDRSVVELSDDKPLVGLTELMMNMFRQRR